MQKNNLFSTRRLLLLFKHSVIVNKKLIGISLAGVAGSMFVLLIFFQKTSNFQNWTNYNYMVVFAFLFVSLGSIYVSQSFPAFRSKEKTLVFLMLPASTSEKFIFEFLTRIIAFVLFMPLLFWCVANLEGAIVNLYAPGLINYKFSFGQGLTEFIAKGKINGWDIFAIVQACLFVFIATFTGACHFSKSPWVKTLFTLSIIVGGYALLAYLLFKGLNLRVYRPSDSGIIFFPKNNEELITFFAVTATVVNLFLLAIAWFGFKEKEV